MTMRCVFAVTLGSFLFATAAVAQDYSVLPRSEAKLLVDQCSRRGLGKVSDFWTPSHSQVLTIEARLPVVLRTSGHKVTVSESYRQYIGVVSHGKRIIYINAFARFITQHDDNPNDWRSHAVTVCDGGDAFWGVEFVPGDSTFQHLAFNGSVD